MKLETKKNLASRTLGVGKGRVVFNITRLSEIKEAITKQDIKDLKESGAISIKEKKGKKKINRKKRRRAGSVKKKVNTKKRDYMNLTRKLRTYTSYLRKTNKITPSEYREIRKKIRTRAFRSLPHMKEQLSSPEKKLKSTSKHKKKTRSKK